MVVNDQAYAPINDVFISYKKWYYDQKVNEPLPAKSEFLIQMDTVMPKKMSLHEGEKVFTGVRLLHVEKKGSNVFEKIFSMPNGGK